jgi:hypothetical protein
LVAEYQKEFANYEQELTQWEAAHKGPRSKSEKEPLPGAKPKPPICKRVLVADFTTEALARILSENPCGVLNDRDELVGWVRSMDAYCGHGKGSDRQFFLSAWSGRSYLIDRKNHADRAPIIIRKPFICVIGGISPDLLPALADKCGREDGFLQRILFTFPLDRERKEWSEAGVSQRAKQGWARVVYALLGLRS